MPREKKKISVIKGEPLPRDITSMDGSMVLCRAGTIVSQELLDRLSNWIVEEKPRDYNLPETPVKQEKSTPPRFRDIQRDEILRRMEFEEIVSEKTRIHLEKGAGDFFAGVSSGTGGLKLAAVEDSIAALVEQTPENPNAPVKLFELKKHASYIYEHSIQCGILAAFIATNLSYPRTQVNAFAMAMMLHDTGMLTIPQELLDRRDRLQGEEIELLRNHTRTGCDLLKTVPGIDPLALIVSLGHHLYADGSGYPDTLDVNDLPPLIHLAVIINRFEELTGKRPYKNPMRLFQAVKTILTERARYHPAALESFISIIGIYPVSTLVELNTREVGVVVRNNPECLFLPEVKLVMDAGGNPYSKEIIANLLVESDRGIAGVVDGG